MTKKLHLTTFMLAGLLAGGVSTTAYAQTQSRDATDRQQQQQQQQQTQQQQNQQRQQQQQPQQSGRESTDQQRQGQQDTYQQQNRQPGQQQQDRQGIDSLDRDRQSQQYGMQDRDRFGTSRQSEHVMGWAESQDFEFGMGMSSLERKALFPFWELDELKSQVNLTDDQRKELVESYTKTLKTVEESKAKARVAIIDLNAELEKDEPSSSSVGRHSDAIARAMGEKQKAVLTHKALVKNTLNKEQEVALSSAGRQYAQRLQGQLGDVRQNIGEAMRGGGGVEEIENILDGSTIPPHVRQRLLEDYSTRINRGDFREGSYGRDQDTFGSVGQPGQQQRSATQGRDSFDQQDDRSRTLDGQSRSLDQQQRDRTTDRPGGVTTGPSTRPTPTPTPRGFQNETQRDTQRSPGSTTPNQTERRSN